MNLDHLRDYEKKAFDNATPIFLAPEKELKKIDSIPPSLSALARVNNFSGEMGVVLANEEGVLLGVGGGADPFITASAAEKLPEGDYRIDDATAPQNIDAALLGWLMGGYQFDRYRAGKSITASLIAPAGADVAAARRSAEAIGLARDLVNTPASDMLPDHLESETRLLADRYSAKLEVISGDGLLEENFPMIHAVGRASFSAPRLLDMKWGREDAPKVTLVGKGVCFDSGGLNLKGAAGMILMKKDMGGAANALALALMIMDAKLDVRLRVLIPAVENAIDGSAFRPSDILQSRKGLSVEIGNTDAEGRLVLGDALTYGGEENPDLMISLATLTGAARVAVGPDLAPYYTDDDDLSAAIEAGGKKANDPVWRMPLWAPYASMLSSPIADLNNISSGSFAGSVTAALFLKRFVPEAGAWAHFDIYAWRPKALPGRPQGGEAQGIRALYDALTERYG